MDTKNNFSDESADDLRIIELLTPKHGRKMPEWPSRPKKRNPLTRISAVAAMMCVCTTIALGLVFSVRGSAVPKPTAIASISNTEDVSPTDS